jgi:hypothetical protein
MVDEQKRVFDVEKRNVVRVPIDKSSAERKQEYVKDKKEAKRLHELAKEELRHTRNLRKHLQPFEESYLADAGTLVEFEVVGERPVQGEGLTSGGVQVCPTCGKEEMEKIAYGEETKDWIRKSTDSLEDIERHIDNIRIKAEEPTLLKKYEDKFGEKLLIKERARGYDWTKEIEMMGVEKPSWFTGEEKKEAAMETVPAKEKTEKKMTLANAANIIKIFEPSVKHPWHSIRCLLISERTQPKKRVLKGTVMVVDVILWIPLLLVRVPIFAVLKLKNVVKRKK